MTRNELERIWAEVKANGARLESCPGHRFVAPRELDGVLFGRLKVTCTVCGGTESILDARRYLDGVLAADRDPTLAAAARDFNEQLDAAWERRKG